MHAKATEQATSAHEREALARLAARGVYVLFDPRVRADWVDCLSALAAVGIPWFQLRAKGASPAQVRGWAPTIREAVGSAVWLLNDDPRLAKEVGADGVHVGPDDPAPSAARRDVGSGAVVGASGDDEGRVTGRAAEGATYFGIGTYRVTTTKEDAGEALGPEGLHRAVRIAERPAVAVGGVRPEDLAEVHAAGALGAAVYGGIWEAGEPVRAARRYMAAWPAQPVHANDRRGCT